METDLTFATTALLGKVKVEGLPFVMIGQAAGKDRGREDDRPFAMTDQAAALAMIFLTTAAAALLVLLVETKITIKKLRKLLISTAADKS